MNDVIDTIAVQDGTKRRTFSGVNPIAGEPLGQLVSSVVHPGGDENESEVKVKVREYVSRRPEQAALAAVAAGAALTGLIRYLIRRKKTKPSETLTR